MTDDQRDMLRQAATTHDETKQFLSDIDDDVFRLTGVGVWGFYGWRRCLQPQQQPQQNEGCVPEHQPVIDEDEDKMKQRRPRQKVPAHLTQDNNDWCASGRLSTISTDVSNAVRMSLPPSSSSSTACDRTAAWLVQQIVHAIQNAVRTHSELTMQVAGDDGGTSLDANGGGGDHIDESNSLGRQYQSIHNRRPTATIPPTTVNLKHNHITAADRFFCRRRRLPQQLSSSWTGNTNITTTATEAAAMVGAHDATGSTIPNRVTLTRRLHQLYHACMSSSCSQADVVVELETYHDEEHNHHAAPPSSSSLSAANLLCGLRKRLREDMETRDKKIEDDEAHGAADTLRDPQQQQEEEDPQAVAATILILTPQDVLSACRHRL